MKTDRFFNQTEIDAALSTIKGAFWEINFKSKEEHISDWFIRSLGYDPQKFGKIVDFRDIVLKEDHAKLDAAWKQCAKTGYKQEFDCTFKYVSSRKTHAEIWARGRVVEFDEKGKPVKFSGIQLNISKIRKINKELQRITKIIYKQSREIKDFASITSHNLRSPMSNLVTLINFYMKSETEADKAQIFEMIKKASNKLAEIIDDMGNILSISSVPDLKHERINFAESWQKVLDLSAADLTYIGVDITANFKITGLFYPRAYIESIFLNLLSNSVKYREPSRPLKIEINSWKQGGKIWLSYQDNGTGIDLKRYGEKIFGYGKTFHVHPEAKGIGLFITKMQIESMGGHIEVQSKLGEWTKFLICFYA